MGYRKPTEGGSARSTFVGRKREIGELLAALDDRSGSYGDFYLVSGEPGIGKTRLVDELAEHARARGVRVVWGRCLEGAGAPAYWPFIQVLRTCLNELDPEHRRSTLQSEVAPHVIEEVALIVPELRPTLAVRRSAAAPLDAEQARFRLFDAVANLLKSIARSLPMLIVFDDLHDADQASLMMLRLVASELRNTGILTVGTYRDVEVRRSPALVKLIGDLSRDARSIALGGLSEPEVAKFVELSADQTPDAELVSKLYSATDGNPLFVEGIVRLLIAEREAGRQPSSDNAFKIPDGVRAAIRLRVDALAKETISLLSVAAVLGKEFEVSHCQPVAGFSMHKIHRLLDEAAAAGIVTLLRQGQYRFSHALIRDAVYEEIKTDRRPRLHCKIGEVIEKIYGKDLAPHLALLAHHFREAGVADKAIDYSIRAGRAAASVLAFEDAMVHWQAALELMEERCADARRRAELLGLLRGVAFGIDQAKSVQYGESAIALFESIGCLEEAAVIHVQLGRSFAMVGQPLTNIALAREHFRRAEIVLAKGPETISLGLVYSGVALAAWLGMNAVEGVPAARRAMEIADRLGDKVQWADSASQYALQSAMSGRLAEAFLMWDQAFEAVDQANNPGTGLTVAWLAGGFSNWLGDPRKARGWFERELNRPRNAQSPWRRQLLSTLAGGAYVVEGQLSEARRMWGSENWAASGRFRFWVAGEWEEVATLQEAELEKSSRAGDAARIFDLSIHLGGIYFLLDEYARAEAHLQYGLDNADRGPVLMQEMRARPWLARVYVAMNRLDAAAEQLARCREILAGGEDWRGRAGDVARAEAVVAAVQGNHDVAEGQFESAVAIQRRYHLVWEEADTLHHWGRALAAAGDRARAVEKLDAAIEIYHSRGASTRFIEYVMADKLRAPPTPIESRPQTAADDAKPAGEEVIFRNEGEFWTIAYLDRSFRLRDMRGLHYIVYLLSHPGERFHVRELAAIVEGDVSSGAAVAKPPASEQQIRGDLGDAGPMLDHKAQAEYRARLAELRAGLDEAERLNDRGRAERIQQELEFVSGELSAALGLGGRDRKMSDYAERARLRIGKAIRSSVSAIREHDPSLGHHFSACIRTGYFCAYTPDPAQRRTWKL